MVKNMETQSNGRIELSERYIKHIRGTQIDDLLKTIVKINDETTLEYLLGAEQMTLKTFTQLQDIHASEYILGVWSQILAIISFEIEQRTQFKGNE